VKHSSLLCAEGILLEDIIANDKVKVLDDCLFCIHLMRQYSAARELEEFLKSKKDSSADEAHNAKYYQALKVSTGCCGPLFSFRYLNFVYCDVARL
jgi:hypothetical protein